MSSLKIAKDKGMTAQKQFSYSIDIDSKWENNIKKNHTDFGVNQYLNKYSIILVTFNCQFHAKIYTATEHMDFSSRNEILKFKPS